MDEVKALEAIFSGDLEVVNVQPLVIFVVHLVSSSSPVDDEEEKEQKVSFRLTFELPDQYPNSPPSVSVASAKLSREKSAQFLVQLDRLARSLMGTPMLFELITWSKENVKSFCQDPGAVLALPSAAKEISAELLLIEIDHMRDERNYVKAIRHWVDETGLDGGRLLVCGSGSSSGGRTSLIVYLLLQGDPDGLRSYERRHRTENVDVDSRGRACKERMMKVVCKVGLGEGMQRFRDFQVVRVGGSQDLKEWFRLHGLGNVFEQYSG